MALLMLKIIINKRCKPFLKAIATPTLIVHAKDDPMLSIKAVPNSTDVSEYVTLRISEKGGHVGLLVAITRLNLFTGLSVLYLTIFNS